MGLGIPDFMENASWVMGSWVPRCVVLGGTPRYRLQPRLKEITDNNTNAEKKIKANEIRESQENEMEIE